MWERLRRLLAAIPWRRVSKLIGAALGGVTGGGVTALAAALGVDLTSEQVGLIVAICSALGTYLAPANAPPGDKVAPSA